MKTNASYFDPKKTSLGVILKRERLSQEISRRALSELTDIHVNSISQYENGLIEPPFSKFQKLMEALGINASVLLSVKEG